MSNKKPRYSVEQHSRLGLELQTIRDRLVAITEDLSLYYPVKTAAFAKRALDAIDELRSRMDSEICREQAYNKNFKATKIYYRAGRGDYTKSPKPILPFRVVDKD